MPGTLKLENQVIDMALENSTWIALDDEKNKFKELMLRKNNRQDLEKVLSCE